MCWEILRIGEQKDRAVMQSLKSLLGWSPFQERGTWISWRIVKKYALKLSWNAYTWHELDDLTSCGPWTNWQDQSPEGQERVTNDKLVWFQTCITQVTADNIVMWVTRLSIVDWVYFKTQTLVAPLKTRNQPQREVLCIFCEVEHLLLLFGCKRNKSQYPTVPQNRKFFCWMLDCEWMDYLVLIYGMWW